MSLLAWCEHVRRTRDPGKVFALRTGGSACFCPNHQLVSTACVSSVLELLQREVELLLGLERLTNQLRIKEQKTMEREEIKLTNK